MKLIFDTTIAAPSKKKIINDTVKKIYIFHCT